MSAQPPEPEELFADTVLQIPQSKEAEQAVLGSILIDPENMHGLRLQPSDFYQRKNQWIFQAMQDVKRAGKDLDYITLCGELESKKRLPEIGGPAYLMGLVNQTSTSMHIEAYQAIVLEAARRRRVIEVAAVLANKAYDQAANLDGAISSALDGLSKSIVTSKGAEHISVYLDQIYDEVGKAAENPKDVYGIPTGFRDWDKLTFGLQPGEVIKLTGEPGLGKSLLSMQVLANAAKAGHPGVLYELEMSCLQVVRRQISGESKITTHAMRSGRMQEDDWPKFTHAIEVLAALPVYLSGDSQMTTMDIRADLHRLIDQFGIEVVVIDYEGLLADDVGKDDNERGKIVSSRVHGIIKDLNLTAIVIDDMNKVGISGQEKGKAGIAGSARKLHDADQIWIMRKEGLNTVRVHCDKNREGSSDIFFDLVKLPQFPCFGDKARMP